MLGEYKRFLFYLSRTSVPNDVRKIGAIVLKHIVELAQLGTAHGKRTQKFIEFSQNEFANISPEINIHSDSHQERNIGIKRLKNISIESFRGFTQKEEFDLEAPIVLIYGPMAQGKQVSAKHLNIHF